MTNWEVIEMTEEKVTVLLAVYVVSKEYGKTLVKRHTLGSEARITYEQEKSREREGFEVQMWIEHWQGEKCIDETRSI